MLPGIILCFFHNIFVQARPPKLTHFRQSVMYKYVRTESLVRVAQIQYLIVKKKGNPPPPPNRKLLATHRPQITSPDYCLVHVSLETLSLQIENSVYTPHLQYSSHKRYFPSAKYPGTREYYCPRLANTRHRYE